MLVSMHCGCSKCDLELRVAMLTSIPDPQLAVPAAWARNAAAALAAAAGAEVAPSLDLLTALLEGPRPAFDAAELRELVHEAAGALLEKHCEVMSLSQCLCFLEDLKQGALGRCIEPERHLWLRSGNIWTLLRLLACNARHAACRHARQHVFG